MKVMYSKETFENQRLAIKDLTHERNYLEKQVEHYKKALKEIKSLDLDFYAFPVYEMQGIAQKALEGEE
jgi:hypothetical protein